MTTACARHPELNGARYANGSCAGCAKESARAWRERNPEKATAATAKWQAEHAEHCKTRNAEWYAAHPGYGRQRAAEWRSKNQDKFRAAVATWRKTNPAKARAMVSARRKQLRLRVPPWANLLAIRKIYDEAAANGLTVDHVVPLNGKLVSGLHVENNLQIMTRAANCKKHASFDVEMYEHSI
jgi:hypothetical protein